MEGLRAEQDEIRCPSCGGQGTYRPEAAALVCRSCGNARDLSCPDRDEAARAETAHDPARNDDIPEGRGADLRRRASACLHRLRRPDRLCRPRHVGELPLLRRRRRAGPRGSRLRDHGPRAFPHRRDGGADEGAGRGSPRRLAAPRDLARAAADGRLAGLYAPFWTFDSEEAIEYWARYKVRSGKRTRIRTVRGRMRTRFNDLLVPASPHVTALIRDGILHDFKTLGPARLPPPGYLAGFAAERHHQTVAEGLRANEDDKALLIRNRIKKHEGRPNLFDYRLSHRHHGHPLPAHPAAGLDRPLPVPRHGLSRRRLGHRRAHLRRASFLNDQARALFRGHHGGRHRGRAGLGRGRCAVSARKIPPMGQLPLDQTRHGN